jgi:hypothetical protein
MDAKLKSQPTGQNAADSRNGHKTTFETRAQLPMA